MLANGDDRVGGDEARGGHGGHADAREGTVATAEEVGAGRLLPGEHAIGGLEERSVGATVPSQEAFVGEGRADQLDVAPLSHVGDLLLDRLLEHRHQAQSVVHSGRPGTCQSTSTAASLASRYTFELRSKWAQSAYGSVAGVYACTT